MSSTAIRSEKTAFYMHVCLTAMCCRAFTGKYLRSELMRQLLRLFCLTLAAFAFVAEADPVLHGYGGRDCPDFLETYRGWETGDERAVLDYFGYQQWLAGMVTAMSLVTGEDVLRGADVEGMMRRIRRRCEDDREREFFSAANAYLKELSQLP
jgi:hypothetical protein